MSTVAKYDPFCVIRHLVFDKLHGIFNTVLQGTYPEMEGEFEYRGVRYCSLFPMETLQRLPDYDFRQDDVIVATYPKSGTRWIQEIIYAIMHDGDLAGTETLDLNARFPFIEFACGPCRTGINLISNMDSPRLIRTHLQRDFLRGAITQGAKVVILLREPKDVLVSYYHFYRFVPHYNFSGSFDDFFDLFKKRRLCHGDWFDWVLSWWRERNNPNFLFLKYEDLQKDCAQQIRKVADFLGRDISSEVVDRIAGYASFGNLKRIRMATMKSEREGTGQLRKGSVGDWENFLSKDQREHVDGIFQRKIRNNGILLEFDKDIDE